jgi:CMP-N-acetylneuraminic acid synthetase
MTNLVIIPARTGSKGIPNKNWRPLNGKTPVQRAIDCCREAGLTNIVVSTDHPNPNLDVQVIYAPEVHRDSSSSLEVVSRVLTVACGDILLYVQPTQPLRCPRHLLDAIHWLEEGASRVASIAESEPAAKLIYRYGDRVLSSAPLERRQDCARTYYFDGTVYGVWRTDFQQYRSLTAGATLLEIPKSETCKLDDLEDWKIAEIRVRARETSSAPSAGRA